MPPSSHGEGYIWGTVIGALILLAVYLDEHQRRLRLIVGIHDLEGVAPGLTADAAAQSAQVREAAEAGLDGTKANA